MGSLVHSAAALLYTPLLVLLFGASSGQELRETDAFCTADGCYAVYFQRKTFLDSWRACKIKGGNLATIKCKEDANIIKNLFSTLDLRNSRTKVQVWIGLQRQPRQCTSTHPLRGFSWTTGDQDTDYTNWQREYSPSVCSVSRCVVMGFSTQERSDNFKWQDGSCSVPVDGFLCHYAYKAMCPALGSEGAGNALYTTPFNLLSTILTHVPIATVATMPCPADIKEEQSALCLLKEDGSAGWSRHSPLCSAPPSSKNWCEQDNGGCEHFCRPAEAHFYCECTNGYKLADDGQSCELSDVCEGAPCEFECLAVLDSFRCACPEGHMLGPDEHSCLDVNECLQSPCEQQCVNTLGTFECRCQEGYHSNNEGGCEDVDECMTDPCEHACENTEGSHICHCHLGFAPLPDDPSQCQDTDECQIAGTCQQMCVNYEGGFECYCEEGYELMSDNYSCQKTDEQSPITPPFPWVTGQPGPGWDLVDYVWNPKQSHTVWPPEVKESKDWPPKVLESDVIWVTSTPQEEKLIDPALHPQTPKKGEEDKVIGGVDWLELGHEPDSELEGFSITNSTTSPATTSPSSVINQYEDGEETDVTFPFFSTSTTSEGAWDWWAGFTSASQKPQIPEDTVIDRITLTEPNTQTKEEQNSLGGNIQSSSTSLNPSENYVEITLSPDQAAPSLLTSSPRPPHEGSDIMEETEGEQSSRTWLLVGLLVPICIFIVVMVALCIVYCTRCAAEPHNKNAPDCYHWISGAHDKQGAANPSAGVKSNV
ncbi:CD248 molecule, endosialin a [Aulostomus maculatus]